MSRRLIAALSSWRVSTNDRGVAAALTRLFGREFELYEVRGENFHVCDGTEFLEPEASEGKACGCTGPLSGRKAKAKAGRGPRPDVLLMFSLSDAPELGVFALASSSWEFVAELPSVLAVLRTGAARFTLRMDLIEFAPSSGVEVSY
ncbi:hypothetical protein ABT381_03075 [Streptomyces sp. NPDC000151]|uniref:recombination directionality factor n=1 Tax=Streptomyces sp. NPDC000151 TaxID=3154244 RepID=UPI003319FFC4